MPGYLSVSEISMVYLDKTSFHRKPHKWPQSLLLPQEFHLPTVKVFYPLSYPGELAGNRGQGQTYALPKVGCFVMSVHIQYHIYINTYMYIYVELYYTVLQTYNEMMYICRVSRVYYKVLQTQNEMMCIYIHMQNLQSYTIQLYIHITK